MNAQTYDIIIVGGGSAGCTLAARLSEDDARQVLLLEAGPDYPTIEEFPAGIALATSTPTSTPDHPQIWDFAGRLSPEQRGYPIARGRIIGGSSAINGTVFMRGRVSDFDGWAALGHDLWSFEQVLPFFKNSERDLDFASTFHGDAGPVPVTRPMATEVRSLTEAFTDACVAAGFPEEPDKNAPGTGGVGPLPRNVSYGIRMNASMVYLTPAVRTRPNLTVLCRHFVRRLLLEGTRVTGVEAEHDGQPVSFRADEVVLSAGAIKSPHLLMLSGVGPAASLREHGIRVIHDSPGVGQNAKDHPTVFPAVRVTGEAPLADYVLLCHTALHYTAPGSDETPDLEISWGRFQDMLMLNLPLNAAKSRGEIFLTSDDPASPPGIDLNYLSDPADLPRMTANLRLALRITHSTPFTPLGLDVLAGVTGDSSDELLQEWIRSNLATCLHTHNTTAMGAASDAGAVVDQRCRVHGVEGLRVADVGIIPFIRNGPAATAVMIGERVAALIDEQA